MRSRFAAYALGRIDYIIDTTDPSGPQYQADTTAWAEQIQRFCTTTRFVGLRIVDASAPLSTTATVHFAATLQQGGLDASFAEVSTFHEGADGRWRYHSGQRVSG